MKGKLYKSKTLRCLAPNSQCGGRCLEPSKTCLEDSIATKLAINQLLKTGPKQLLKQAKAKGFGPVQYITQAEAMRSLAVYSGGNIFDMKTGAIPHPYIKINKIEQAAVDKYHDKLKADSQKAKAEAKAAGKKRPFTLYDRLSQAGIRGDNPRVSTEDKVKIFLRLYMEQNGQSFATGNKVNLNRLVVDHVIPLTAGGKNVASNMVLIESNINYWKKAIPSQEAMASALRKKISLAAPQELLKSFAKATVSGNLKLAEKLKQQIQTINKQAARVSDKALSDQYRQGAQQKKSLANDYGQGNWAKFNTIAALEPLNGKETKQLLKAQSGETSTVRGWVRLNAAKEQVELAPTNVQKAQIFLTNGGSWKDLPASWKEAFKDKYQNNKHPKGNAAIKKQYGNLPGAPDWLQ
jgi:hypothetical protein